MSFQTLARTDISAAQEENLVAVVRGTESALVADESTGRTIRRYFPTPEQDAAMSTLISAYVNDIRRAAKGAKVISREDAEMVATEKFIDLARAEGRSNERLAGFVSRAMVNAVMDADAEAGAVRIPPDTLRRYFNLVAEWGSVEAAYAVCKMTTNNFDPITLLAVHRALNAESIEALACNEDGTESEDAFTADDAVGAFSAAPGPEETVIQADLIRHLFTLTTEDQEVILRLAYGFTDTRSEALRVRNGYQYDAPLSDAQISPVVAKSRASVQRSRHDALRTMYAAVMDVAASSTDPTQTR